MVVHKFFNQKIMLMIQLTRFHRFLGFDSVKRCLSYFGWILVFLWLVEIVFLYKGIDEEKSNYFLFSFFLLVVGSLSFNLCIELFLHKWLNKNCPFAAEKEKKLFVLHTFAPLYFGSTWLILLPFMTLKSQIMHHDHIDLLIRATPLLASWIIFVLYSLQTISNLSLSHIPQKLKKQRSPAFFYLFFIILFVFSTLICFIHFLPSIKLQVEQIVTKEEATFTLNQIVNALRKNHIALPTAMNLSL